MAPAASSRPSLARRQRRSRYSASRASSGQCVARRRARPRPWRRGVRPSTTARGYAPSWHRIPTPSCCRAASCAVQRPATRCRRGSRTWRRTGRAAATAAATRPSASGASPPPRRRRSTHRWRRTRRRSRPWTRCTPSSPRIPTPSSCRRVSPGPHSRCHTSLPACGGAISPLIVTPPWTTMSHRTNGHGHSRSALLLPTAEPPRASPPHPLRPAHGRQRPLLDDGPRHGGEAAHARGALGREALPHGRDATEEGTHRTNAPHAPPHDAHAATHGPRTRRHAQPCTATHAHRACIPLASPLRLHSRAPCSRRAP